MLFYFQGSEVFVNEHELIFINSGVIHSSTPKQQDTEILILQFDINTIFNMQHSEDYKYLLPFINTVNFPYRKENVYEHAEFKQIVNHMDLILEELTHADLAYEMAIKAELYKILVIFYRSQFLHTANQAVLGEKTVQYDQLKAVFLYVEEHYAEPITIDDMCELVHLNYHYFCRLFRKTTGKSFVEYLNFVRLSEAEKLLLTKPYSITEIALKVGFSSASYFNKVFKKEKAMTPSFYRSHCS